VEKFQKFIMIFQMLCNGSTLLRNQRKIARLDHLTELPPTLSNQSIFGCGGPCIIGLVGWSFGGKSLIYEVLKSGLNRGTPKSSSRGGGSGIFKTMRGSVMVSGSHVASGKVYLRQ